MTSVELPEGPLDKSYRPNHLLELEQVVQAVWKNEIFLTSISTKEGSGLQDALGKLGFAIQFEKSAGLLAAEDVYLRSGSSLKSILDDSHGSLSPIIAQLHKLTERRLRDLQDLKQEREKKQKRDKDGGYATLKWAENYSQLLPSQGHASPSKEKKKKKKKKKNSFIWEKNQHRYLPTMKQNGSDSIKYGTKTARKIQEHFGSYLSSSISLRKDATIRIKNIQKEHKSAIEEQAFTVWFSNQEKALKLSDEMVDLYEAVLRCLLFPSTPQTAHDLEKVIDEIRHAFNIEFPQHQQIRINLEKSMGDNSFQVLSRELEIRVQCLDEHPFYSADSFRSPDGFRTWKEKEQKRIQELMQKIGIDKDREYVKRTKNRPTLEEHEYFQNTKDSAKVMKKIDYHKGYLVLVSLLIKHESLKKATKKKGVPVEIAKLSPFWNSLLEEYAKVYGIGMIYQRTVYLDILAQSFDHSNHHLGILQHTLQDVLEIMEKENTIMTKKESALIAISVDILRAQIKIRLSHFHDCFPSKSKKDLRNLNLMLKMLQYLSKLEKFIHKKDIPPETFIRESIVKYVHLEYQSMIVRCEKALETSQLDSATMPLNEEKLLLLCDMILDIVLETIPPYLDAFKPYINIVQESLEVFHSVFLEDLTNFCTCLPETLGSSQFLSSNFFELIKRIQEFSFICTKQHPSKIMPISFDIFESLVIRWIHQIAIKICEWTNEACNQEKWEPIDQECLYSSSVVDLFAACYEPLKVLKEFAFVSHEDRLIHEFSKVIKIMLVQYTDCVYKASTSDIPTEYHDKLNKFLESVGISSATNKTPKMEPKRRRNRFILEIANRSPFLIRSRSLTKDVALPPLSTDITKNMCLFVNNIETARMKLSDLDEELDGILGDSIRDALQFLRGALSKSIGVVLFKMNHAICPMLGECISKKDRKILKNMIEYMDKQMEVIAESIYPGVLTKLIKLLWETLMNDMIDIILPDTSDQSISISQALFLEEIIEPLQDFFHANGVGLAMEFLQKGSCAFVRGIIGLYEVSDTQSLIELYQSFEKSTKVVDTAGDREDFAITGDHILNLLASKNDKEAQLFVKNIMKQKKNTR